MNLSESTGKILGLVFPSQGSSPGWKGYALRATFLAAVTLGSYVLLFKRKDFRCSRLWSRKTKTTESTAERLTDNDQEEPDEIILAELEKLEKVEDLLYNWEMCPICLGSPKAGLKGTCGHLLCAHCMVGYCEALGTSASMPPCPLCRAPLDSIALVGEPLTANSNGDPETDGIHSWIREYNRRRWPIASHPTPGSMRRGLLYLVNLFALFCAVTLFVKLQVARLRQTFPWRSPFAAVDDAIDVIDVILGICLIGSVWFHIRNRSVRHE